MCVSIKYIMGLPPLMFLEQYNSFRYFNVITQHDQITKAIPCCKGEVKDSCGGDLFFLIKELLPQEQQCAAQCRLYSLIQKGIDSGKITFLLLLNLFTTQYSFPARSGYSVFQDQLQNFISENTIFQNKLDETDGIEPFYNKSTIVKEDYLSEHFNFIC